MSERIVFIMSLFAFFSSCTDSDVNNSHLPINHFEPCLEKEGDTINFKNSVRLNIALKAIEKEEGVALSINREGLPFNPLLLQDFLSSKHSIPISELYDKAKANNIYDFRSEVAISTSLLECFHLEMISEHSDNSDQEVFFSHPDFNLIYVEVRPKKEYGDSLTSFDYSGSASAYLLEFNSLDSLTFYVKTTIHHD